MILPAISFVLLGIFFIFQFLYIFVPLFSIKESNKNPCTVKEQRMTVLVPAFNEAKIILNCLEGIRHVNYQNFEVIIVNDGSTDQTFALLDQQLELIKAPWRQPAGKLSYGNVKAVYQSRQMPHLFIVDKENGGKADALNTGTDYALNEIVITLDADSILDSRALKMMNEAFQDKKTIAAGGMVKIGQGFHGNYSNPAPIFSKTGLVKYQIIQYLTDFYLHKFTQSRFKSITVISGAFGAFRKKALFACGGYRKTVGEDMDITLQMHRLIRTVYKNHNMHFVPEAVCYTECPETFRDLLNQRIRWQKGFIDCIFSYKTAFFRQLGFSASLYLLMDSLILGTLNAFPLLFLPVLLWFFPGNLMVLLGAFTIAYCLAGYRSITAIIISRRYGHRYTRRDYRKIFRFIPVEIITYRLLGLLFVTLGTLMYFQNKSGWQASRRSGMHSFLPEPEKQGNKGVI